MSYQEYQDALIEADTRMKRTNGHQFVHILKTRCANCGASPRVKYKCRNWMQTFANQLGVVFQERGIITK